MEATYPLVNFYFMKFYYYFPTSMYQGLPLMPNDISFYGSNNQI